MIVLAGAGDTGMKFYQESRSKGAGGGDRKEGAKRMYAMMKKFEKVA